MLYSIFSKQLLKFLSFYQHRVIRRQGKGFTMCKAVNGAERLRFYKTIPCIWSVFWCLRQLSFPQLGCLDTACPLAFWVQTHPQMDESYAVLSVNFLQKFVQSPSPERSNVTQVHSYEGYIFTLQTHSTCLTLLLWFNIVFNMHYIKRSAS